MRDLEAKELMAPKNIAVSLIYTIFKWETCYDLVSGKLMDVSTV